MSVWERRQENGAYRLCSNVIWGSWLAITLAPPGISCDAKSYLFFWSDECLGVGRG